MARRVVAGESPLLRSTDFDRSIYCSDETRTRLWRMQHFKCCFCERTYETKHSTVEHFRPKTEASDDIRNRGNKRPGYWWLAYEFENLYFCCKNCNTPKATFFPLAPGTLPLRPPELPSVSTERALLLNPGFDDPEPHIEWRWSSRRQAYVPVGTTDEGRNTVRATQLDQRDNLCTLRGDYYRRTIRPVIQRYRQAMASGDEVTLALARNDAQQLAKSEAEYAGMARYLLRREGLLPPAPTARPNSSHS